MVAFKENSFVAAFAVHQLVEDLSRRGSAIDVVTKKNLNAE